MKLPRLSRSLFATVLCLGGCGAPSATVSSPPPRAVVSPAAVGTTAQVEVEPSILAIPPGMPSLAALRGVWIRYEPTPPATTTMGAMAAQRTPRRVEGWIVADGRAVQFEPEPAATPGSKPDAAFIRETAGTLEALSPCTLAWHATGKRRSWTVHYTVGHAPGGEWFLGGELAGVRIGEQLVLCGADRVVVLAEGRCGEHTRRAERWISHHCAWELVEVAADRVRLRGPMNESLVLHPQGDLLFTTPSPQMRFEPIAESEMRQRVAAEGRLRADLAWQRAQPGLGTTR